jgi:hypothetical protein
VHRIRSALVIRTFASWLVLLAGLLSTMTAGADPNIEREVRALQKRAIEQDNLNMNYAAAARRLTAAIARCGAARCSPALKAAVLRDLGAMQALSNNVEEAKGTFARALQVDPTLELDPAYTNPTLQGVWNEVKRKAAAGGSAPAGAPAAPASPPPAGDFTHTPPSQALVRTPLAIYAEYPAGSDSLGRVLVKYKGAGMNDWKTLELKKVGDGFGGLIPCKDVTPGMMQYYLQGFDPHEQPLAMSGSRIAPFTVEVTEQITGTEPSLPGRPPPEQCSGGEEGAGGASSGGGGGSTDCPPDFPGCKAPKKEVGRKCSKDDECVTGLCYDDRCSEKKGGGEECDADVVCASGVCKDDKCSDKKGVGDYCEKDDECASNRCDDSKCRGGPSAEFHRVWIGLGVQADLYVVPSAINACVLKNGGTQLSSAYSCVDPNTKANFPGQNGSLNSEIAAGNVQSGVKFGNTRILASIDYAFTQNLLLGLHGGYVLFTDPATGKPGAAFAPIHVEARLTYVFGQNALSSPTVVTPLVLLAAGIGEFDAFVPVTVGLNQNSGSMLTPQAENAWVTAGPVFLAGGGGLRFKLGSSLAATAALKLEGAFGGTAGVLFGIAPEIGFQFGL